MNVQFGFPLFVIFMTEFVTVNTEPTLEDIQELEHEYAIVYDNNIHIRAFEVTHNTFSYICPFCSKFKFINGNKRKKPIIVLHTHDNEQYYKQRIEYCTPQCKSCKNYRKIAIWITDRSLEW